MPTKLRKPVYQLAPVDLSGSPVWEFALDEEGAPDQDETTVRPYRAAGPLDPSAGMFVVAAHFWLADGTPMQGYLTPPPRGDSGLGTIQPTIVTEAGQVGFWCGCCPPDTAHSYQLLGRTTSVFPVRFESAVPLVGGVVASSIPGFLYYGSDLTTVHTTL